MIKKNIVHVHQKSKIYVILFLIHILSACHLRQQKPTDDTQKKIQLQGHWYKSTIFPKSDPIILKFDSASHYECFDLQHGQRRTMFRLQNDQLITPIHRFRIHQMTSDSLVLSHLDDPKKRKMYYSSQNPAEINSPEKNIFVLLPALMEATVESRIRKLIQCLDEGDYVPTETLFYLAGVNPVSCAGERNDVPIQRHIIASVKSIQKINDEFIVHFFHEDNIRVKFPIYENKSMDAKKKAVLDIVIKPHTKAQIIPHKNGIRINIHGIKVGKGFLKVNIPTFTVQNDMGKLLGIKFSLVKK